VNVPAGTAVAAAAAATLSAADLGEAEALPDVETIDDPAAGTGTGADDGAGVAAAAEGGVNQRPRRLQHWRRGYKRWKQKCA
jgi:hypothetical protein